MRIGLTIVLRKRGTDRHASCNNLMRYLLRAALFTLLVCFAVRGDAAPVTDWHTFRATTATTLSGQGTNAPVVGSLTESANSSFVIGYLAAPLTLLNIGDQITLTFNVSFNDAAGMLNAGDNFRFALFDENGQARVTADNTAAAGVDGQTDNYRGYIFGVKNGSGTGSGGSIRERIAALASGDNAFATVSTNAPTAPSLGTVGGDPVTLTSSVNGDNTGPLYFGQMTLTLTGDGVDVSGVFIDTSTGLANSFSALDTTTPFSTTFGAVGFLIGNGLSVDQVLFSNVNVVPEPGSLTLCGIAAALLATWRRQRTARV